MISEELLFACAVSNTHSAAIDPHGGVTAPAATDDFVCMVWRHLDDNLDARPPTLSNVAQALAIGERTLQRRLRAAGTSFQKLRHDVRRRRLRNLLREEMRSDALSRALGFSDARSLRRWRRASAQAPPAKGEASGS